jgi:tRNA threonylcarbamoyladenosine biosynthesis protein TsaE
VKVENQTRQLSFIAHNLEETHNIGQQIASQLVFPSCVYLQAAMGAGKTTLAKSIIQALGYVGEVTSPTYNLVQEYQVDQGVIYHMDLYRLDDPSEVEFLAIDDLWSEQSLFLIEWPERASGYLQPATSEIVIDRVLGKSSETREIVLKLFN